VNFRFPAYAAPVLARPLPVQMPTAFVRIRPRGLRLCGEARTRPAQRCTVARPSKRA